MKLIGGDIMSNTINWLDSNKLFALLTQSLSEKAKDISKLTRWFKEREQDYYAGKLSPEEEAEMIAFINRYAAEELE